MARKAKNVEDVYELSPLQQGFLFHSILDRESGAYFIQTGQLTRGLDLGAYQRAWQRVVERHTIFRTSFHWDKLEKPLQVVHREVIVPFEELDLRDLSAEQQTRRVREYMREDRRRGFSLTEAPLLRVAAFRINEDDYRVLTSWHHILLDGWSGPLLLRDLQTFYQSFRQGRDLDLPAPPPYRDYIAWVRRQDLAKAEAFWRNYLRGFASATPLPLDRLPGTPAAPPSRPLEHRIDLTSELTTGLRDLAARSQCTLNIVVQGAWALLLGRYAGQNEVVIGAGVSGRPPNLAGVENMIGLFMNTLPVRIDLAPDKKILAWLHEMQVGQGALTEYEYSPLVQVQQWSEVPRGTSLFNIMFLFENFPAVGAAARAKGGEKRTSDMSDANQMHFPLSLIAVPLGDQIRLLLSHAPERIAEQDALRLLDQLQTVLTSMVNDSTQKLFQVSLLTPAEQKQLQEWNRTQTEIPKQQCVHHLFEDQVFRTPDAVAVSYRQERWTYSDLERRANRLAHRLRGMKVGPDVPVALCVDRGPLMLVGLLAILKSGGAYVPLDPSYPVSRIAFMLGDAAAPVVLTQQHCVSCLGEPYSRILCLDDPEEIDLQSKLPETRLDPIGHPENLAYVIYTSGSTGIPKGVEVPHRALVNFLLSMSKQPGLRANDVLLAVTTLSFDIAALELFLPLSVGARVHLLDKEDSADGAVLSRSIRDCAVTVMQATPATWRLLLESNWAGSGQLRILCGGEALPLDLAVQLLARTAEVWNVYGPTETTVWSSLKRLERGLRTVNIGRPIANTQMYVLDDKFRQVPVGVPGELYIGGLGLARGYRKRAGLTADRFLPDPFADSPGQRMYRTGDLAGWLPSGELDCLGRIDHQVKIRGYRIELGEIEAALRQHPGIHDSVVIAREESVGVKQLVAYLTSNSEAIPEVSELRASLRDRLPDYMIPSVFVGLDSLPLTPNGKVDRKALPVPETGRTKLDGDYVRPRNPTEEALAGIYATLLKVDRVSARDNFFELGGHSILATQLVTRVREALKVELPLRLLFEAPTIAGLAERVETLQQERAALQTPALVPVPRDRPLPLSFAQQRLWFLDQLTPGLALYNVPGRVRVRGNLDQPALILALNELWRRHEVLRTRFPAEDGQPKQVIDSPTPIDLPVTDLRDLSHEQRPAELRRLFADLAHKPFDLATGPLARLRLVRVRDDEAILFYSLHHTITDLGSMDVINRELTVLYDAFRVGRESPLPELPVQYADFAIWQRSWLQGEILQKQLDFWRDHLRGIATLELPTDRPRPPVQTFQGAFYRFTLPADLLGKLHDLGRHEGTTLFMTLLAAFQTLLGRYSGQEDVVVGAPIAGRSRRELEGLIGFFVNTLVLRCDLSGDPSFPEFLRRVREVCLGAYSHQEIPFDMLVENLQPRRDPSRNPFFQVVFGVQKMPSMGNEPLEGSPRRSGNEKETSARDSFSGNGTSKFDLSLQCYESPQGLRCVVGYNTDLFEPSTISRLADHYHALLRDIVKDPKRNLSTFSLVDDSRGTDSTQPSHSGKEPSADEISMDSLSAQLDQLSDAELSALLEKTLSDQEKGS